MDKHVQDEHVAAEDAARIKADDPTQAIKIAGITVKGIHVEDPEQASTSTTTSTTVSVADVTTTVTSTSSTGTGTTGTSTGTGTTGTSTGTGTTGTSTGTGTTKTTTGTGTGTGTTTATLSMAHDLNDATMGGTSRDQTPSSSPTAKSKSDGIHASYSLTLLTSLAFVVILQ